jgi:hypothetical protein
MPLNMKIKIEQSLVASLLGPHNSQLMIGVKLDTNLSCEHNNHTENIPKEV